LKGCQARQSKRKWKTICTSCLKAINIHKYKHGCRNPKWNVPKGFKLITKPKPKKEGEGFEWRLRTPPCHPRLKLQKFENVFGDKSSLGMKIRPHMQNKGHHIEEELHLNF
jgi:hypothetical protein